jgi:hypothetical protein
LLIVINRFKGGKNPTTLLSPTVWNVGVVLVQEEGHNFGFSRKEVQNDTSIIFSFLCVCTYLRVSSLVDTAQLGLDEEE